MICIYTIRIFRNGRFNIINVQNVVGIFKIFIFAVNLKLSGLNHKNHMGTQEDI